MSILYPSSQFNYGGVPGQESKLFYLPGKLFYSDTDAAAAGAAAGAPAAASAAASDATTAQVVVKTEAVAEAAAAPAPAAGAALAAAPAAASVSAEQNSWTLNIISFLVFVNLLLHMGVTLQWLNLERCPAQKFQTYT